MQIACRLSCYGPFQARALEHLAELGVRAVELHTPTPAELQPLIARLDAHRMHVETVQVAVELERTDITEQLAPQLESAVRLGARQLLIVPRAGLAPNPAIDANLREVANLSAAVGIVALLEMHPRVAGNSDEAHETLSRVAHPNLKINFDTANVGYYNRQREPVRELERIGRWIGGVHLKDGSGRVGHRWFPALGQGTIDFAAIFNALGTAGFCGTCAIEIGAARNGNASQAAVEAAVAASVEHLRRIGRMP